MTTDLNIWVAAILTLAIYSFLVKENALFRSVEHLFVGVAAGYGLLRQWQAINRIAWTPAVQGDVIMFVPIILGLLLFTRFVKGYTWVSRWPLAFLMGLGASLSMKAIESDFVRQIQATAIRLNSLDNIFIVVGTVTALAYFYFTFRHSSVLNAGSRVGRYVLMLCFGAAFGNAVMGRISLLISRLQFLFTDWIYLIKT